MSTVIRGIAASPGIAIARVVIMEAAVPGISEQSCAENPDVELERYEAAIGAARIELEGLRDRTRETLGELKAEIFQAHLSILKDPELRSEVVRLIREEQRTAVAAVRGAEATFVDLLSLVEDEMFKARIDDIKDLCRRIVSHLEGRGGQSALKVLEPSIVVAADLTPSETASLDRSMVKAFIIATGSAVSHSSILARSLGIPAVVGAGAALLSLRAGSLVIVDGTDEHGAEGVGLFRTEFMYMDRSTLPGEDEQFEVYRHVLSRMAPRPVVIRTLDVGGDKRLDCLPMEPEANPFLGVRAIRLCLANEGLFRTQLRALLRASTSGRLRIMFPMIATIEELRAARAVLDEERAALKGTGVAVADDIEVGIMIEIPAAAVMADSLAAEVDFFSVGSNDLTQYTMAADRMNPAVAYLHCGPHPAVLRLIGMAAVAAKRRGIWIGLCGELAADPLAAPLLVGMGISELSMGAASIPAIRALLSETDSGDARRLYETARDMESAADVRRLMEGANA